MSELRDSIYYFQLAKTARKLASGHADPVVRRRLRETAIQHDRKARALERLEANEKTGKKRPLRELFE